MKLRRQQQIERELNGYRAWIDRAGGFIGTLRVQLLKMTAELQIYENAAIPLLRLCRGSDAG